jgi:hypothetical protein
VLRLSFAVEPGRAPGDPKAQCSFCQRELAALRHLVVGPGVSICDACCDRAVRALQACRAKGWRRWWDLRPRRRPADEEGGAGPYRAGAGVECSFCGDGGVEDTIFAEHARICPPCVRLALDVFREMPPNRALKG